MAMKSGTAGCCRQRVRDRMGEVNIIKFKPKIMIKKYLLVLTLVLALTVPVMTLAENNNSGNDNASDLSEDNEDINETETSGSSRTIAELQAKIKELMAQLARLQGNTSVGECRLEITQDLFFGDEDFQSSHNIQTLQKLLQKNGYLTMPNGANYGFFGRITLNAVTRFQATNGINEVWKDNINYVGPQTRRALSNCGNNYPIPTPPIPQPYPVPDIGKLTVISPNGGEVFKIGDKMLIRWIGSNNDNSAFARINLTGFNYYYIFPQTRDDGVESWVIPTNIQGGSYRVSVSLCRSDNDCYDNDFSDNSFKISAGNNSGNLPPVISGVNGPTTLDVGESGKWKVKASDPENGSLNYSVSWGDEVSRTMSSGSVPTMAKREASQTATFTHTYNTAGNYYPQFYVTDNAGNTKSTGLSVRVGDTGNVNKRFQLLSPNGGEVWANGATQDIKWDGSALDKNGKVRIVLTNNVGYSTHFFSSNDGFEAIPIDITTNDITRVTFPGDVGGRFLVEIYGDDLNTNYPYDFFDASDGIFFIKERGGNVSTPDLAVSSLTFDSTGPLAVLCNKGSKINSFPVMFSVNGVNLNYTPDYIYLASTPGACLTFRYTYSQFPGVSAPYTGWVEVDPNNIYSETNENNNKLTASYGGGNVTPTIRVTSPNGGETWVANSTKRIKWDTQNTNSNDKVTISLQPYYWNCISTASLSCPANANVMRPPILLDSNISVDADYDWIVATDINGGVISTGQYWMKVCLAGNTNICDQSDEPFAISLLTSGN